MLSRDDILRGLRALDRYARDEGKIVDLAVYGGAALALAFDIRAATKDVDAVIRGDPDFARRAAIRIAEDEGWPVLWLNDAVRGFVSEREELELMREFTGADGGLRVHIPSPEYPFAMKCMAMRPAGIDGAMDVADIEFLARRIGVRTAAQALLLVGKFYSASRIPAKTQFGIEEIMERIGRA